MESLSLVRLVSPRMVGRVNGMRSKLVFTIHMVAKHVIMRFQLKTTLHTEMIFWSQFMLAWKIVTIVYLDLRAAWCMNEVSERCSVGVLTCGYISVYNYAISF